MPIDVEGWVEFSPYKEKKEQDDEYSWLSWMDISSIIEFNDEINWVLMGNPRDFNSNASKFNPIAKNRGFPENPSSYLKSDIKWIIEHETKYGKGELFGFTNINYSEIENINWKNDYDIKIEESDWGKLFELVDKFKNLKNIKGLLSINSNSKLNAIPRFNNVIGEIGGYDISRNSNLDSLIGFNAVETINGSPSLNLFYKYVDGFNSLKILNSNFSVTSPYLDVVKGFELLEEINGDFSYGSSSNPQSSLPDFENLRVIDDMCYCLDSNFPVDQISEFPNLEIMGTFRGQGDGLVNLKGFNKLDSVYSIVITHNEFLTSVEGFENLKTVGDEIKIVNNLNLTKISTFDSLEHLGAGLEISDNDKLEKINGFSTLEVAGGFRFSRNSNLKEIIGFNALKTIRTISMSWMDGPEILDGFNALEECHSIKLLGKVINGFGQLKSVATNLTFEGASTNKIIGFESLEEVGTLHIDCPLLNDLPSFDSLKHAELLNLFSMNSIEDISAFDNLSSLGRLSIANNKTLSEIPNFSSLTKLDELTLIANEEIKFIDKFNQIDSLLDLNIRNNQKLETFSGFEMLGYIEKILVDKNSNLYSLEGLNNVETDIGDISSSNVLIINDNPRLSFCSLPLICKFILENENTALISNNAVGCNSEEEISDNCGDVNHINIHTYFDENENGVQDNNEQNLAGIPIQISSSGRTFISNNEPILIRSFDSSIDIELIDDHENWNLFSNEDSFTVELTPDNLQEDVFFGFVPNNVFTSIEASISADPFRCNTEINVNIDIKNLGTTITPAVAYLTIDSRVEDFSFDFEPDFIVDEHRVGWDLSNFYPTETIAEIMELSVPMIESLEDNPNLAFELEIHYSNDNGEEQVITKRYVEAVRCSFDPNDKRSFPQKGFKFLSKDEPITYNIRFQNTGNDVAFDVIVLDTISPLLNLSTFELIGTSHPGDLQVYIDEERQISFEFIGINLLDSLNHEPESHGYIVYQINAIDSVEDFDEITNSASIYFDANLPVHTNETLNLIGEDKDDDGYLVVEDCDDLNAEINPAAEEIPFNNIDENCDGEALLNSTSDLADHLIDVYPNPARDIIYVEILELVNYQISLYDVNGHLILSVVNANQLDVKSITNGMYILEVQDLDTYGIGVEKICIMK